MNRSDSPLPENNNEVSALPDADTAHPPAPLPSASGEPTTTEPLPALDVHLSTEPLVPSQRSASGSTITYTIRQGETLWGIAKKFGTTVDALIAVNELEHSSLRAGQKLTIPR